MGAEAVTAPEIESLVAARKALHGIDCPLHVAVEVFAAAFKKLSVPDARITMLVEAAEFYLKHHPVGAERIALSEMARRFVDSRKRRGLSGFYVSACQRSLNEFSKEFGMTSTELPPAADVVNWLERKFDNPVSRNTHLNTLKTFAVWAKKNQFVPFNTLIGIEPWKKPATEVEIYTVDEMRAILTALPKSLIPAAAIAAFAGLRNSEVGKLDWKEINLERGFITVAAAKAKNATRRLVAIQDNLRAWLKPYAQASGEVAPYGRCHLTDTMRERGLPCKRNALRHSYISYRLALMPDAPRVALECGNSPEMIFQHYRELVTPDDAKAWFEIMPN
jgi:integrase